MSRELRLKCISHKDFFLRIYYKNLHVDNFDILHLDQNYSKVQPLMISVSKCRQGSIFADPLPNYDVSNPRSKQGESQKSYHITLVSGLSIVILDEINNLTFTYYKINHEIQRLSSHVSPFIIKITSNRNFIGKKVRNCIARSYINCCCVCIADVPC